MTYSCGCYTALLAQQHGLHAISRSIACMLSVAGSSRLCSIRNWYCIATSQGPLLAYLATNQPTHNLCIGSLRMQLQIPAVRTHALQLSGQHCRHLTRLTCEANLHKPIISCRAMPTSALTQLVCFLCCALRVVVQVSQARERNKQPKAQLAQLQAEVATASARLGTMRNSMNSNRKQTSACAWK